jgi:pyruvate kinase
MQKIIDWTEENGLTFFRDHPPLHSSKTFIQESICYNAVKMAQQTNAKAIITFTHSGFTAFKISSFRPAADVFAFTMNKSLLPMLSMVWGVRAYLTDEKENIEDYIKHSIDHLKADGLLNEGDVVIHVGSIPVLKKGKTNMLKITHI